MHHISNRNEQIWINGFDKRLKKQCGRALNATVRYSSTRAALLVLFGAPTFLVILYVSVFIISARGLTLEIGPYLMFLLFTGFMLVFEPRFIRRRGRKAIRAMVEARREGRLVRRSAENFVQLERALVVSLVDRREYLRRDTDKAVSATFESYFMDTKELSDQLSDASLSPFKKPGLQERLIRMATETVAHVEDLLSQSRSGKG